MCHLRSTHAQECLYFNEIFHSGMIPSPSRSTFRAAQDQKRRHAMAATVVLDNGAYSLKVGLASDQEPKFLPNCITRCSFPPD